MFGSCRSTINHQPSSIKSLGNYKKVIHRVPVHTTHLYQTLFTLGIKMDVISTDEIIHYPIGIPRVVRKFFISFPSNDKVPEFCSEDLFCQKCKVGGSHHSYYDVWNLYCSSYSQWFGCTPATTRWRSDRGRVVGVSVLKLQF